jgi:spore maturation protein CgeB
LKILTTGYHNPNYLTITEYIERAIKEFGCQLEIFDDRQHIIPGRLRHRIKFFDRLSQQWINRNFLKCVYKVKPDIVLITGGHRIHAKSLQTLKETPARSVLWTTDAPIRFKPILSTAPFYDYIFCQGTEAIELLSKAGIRNAYWLPMACDAKMHRKMHLSEKEHACFANDIVFVGSYHPNREVIIKELTDFDIGIWGPGWKEHCRKSILETRIKGSHTPTDIWIKLYSACKIALSIHYQHPQKKVPVYQASPRIFESMACGAFVMSDYQKDVFSLFKNGAHFVGFEYVNELKKKMRYYLHHADEREKIANRGRREVKKNHRYVDRVEKLLSIVNQNNIQK